MVENMKVAIQANGRNAEFILTFDPGFEADRNMRLLLERDHACEPEIVHVMMRVLREGDVAIDGGANVGYFTCLMSKLVGDTGLVFAIEPAPANIFKLENNLANNKTKNVRVVKSPLDKEIRRTEFHLSPDSGLCSIVPNPDTVSRVETISTTIDAVLQLSEHELRPKLIKLDVEGAEVLAVLGAMHAMKYQPYVLAELNRPALARFGTTVDQLRVLMGTHGYGMWLLDRDGALPRLVPSETELRSERQNLMVLFATPGMVGAAWPEIEML